MSEDPRETAKRLRSSLAEAFAPRIDDPEAMRLCAALKGDASEKQMGLESVPIGVVYSAYVDVSPAKLRSGDPGQSPLARAPLVMIAGTAPARLLAEVRLPPGFSPVDPFDLPDIECEVLRIEIVDFAGVIRPWQWSDTSVDWHEAWGWRIAPDGQAQPCTGCERLTRRGFSSGTDKDWTALCEDCDAGGYDN